VEDAVAGNSGAISHLSVAGIGNELHIVVVGSKAAPSGGHLWHTVRYADHWQPEWGDVEGAVDGNIGTITHLAVAATTEGLHIIAVGSKDGTSGGHLWHTIRRLAGWQPWGDVEGAVAGDVGQVFGLVTAGTPEELHVVVVGSKTARSGGHLWHTVWYADHWQPEWGDVEGAVAGDVGTIAHVTATTTTEGLHIVVLGGKATRSGGHLWHTLRRLGGWQPWGDVEGAVAGQTGEISQLANGSNAYYQAVMIPVMSILSGLLLNDTSPDAQELEEFRRQAEAIFAAIVGFPPIIPSDQAVIDVIMAKVKAGICDLVCIRQEIVASEPARNSLEAVYLEVVAPESDFEAALQDALELLATGSSLLDVRALLAHSPEARQRLDAMYQNIWGRAMTQAEYDIHAENLAVNWALEDVRAAIKTTHYQTVLVPLVSVLSLLP
jgi:hypothetical protein